MGVGVSGGSADASERTVAAARRRRYVRFLVRFPQIDIAHHAADRLFERSKKKYPHCRQVLSRGHERVSCASCTMPRSAATAPSVPRAEGLEDRRTAGAETDPERRLGRLAPEGGERVGVHAGAVVGGDQGTDRLPELAQARDVGVRDANGRRDQPLLEQPCPRFRRRAEPVPRRREVVVLGVHEPLERLEPSGRLGSTARLDLLADATFVTIVHGVT